MTNYGEAMRQLKAQMEALESEMKASQNEIVKADQIEEELERVKEENRMLRQKLDQMSNVIKNQRAMSNIHFGFSEMVRHQLSRMDMEIAELRKRGETDEEDDTE